jgi:SIR2-like domain
MAAKTRVSNANWKLIVEQIHARRCVPFLGAAANVSVEGRYKGLPLGREVALRLLEDLTDLQDFRPETYDPGALAAELLQKLDDADASDPKVAELTQAIRPRLSELVRIQGSLADYADLAQLRMVDLARVALHLLLENGVVAVNQRLRSLLDEEGREPSPLLRTLATLPVPVPLIITTNYDNLMECAFGDRPHRVVVQPVDGFDGDTSFRLSQELPENDDPILYKIHGSFRSPNGDPPSEVVVTEEDYIRFLTVVRQEERGMPIYIQGLIGQSTLLFFGYSLEDWDFRTIFRALVETRRPMERNRAFAFQKDPPDFWVRYWDRKDVTIYNVDLYEFAEELQQRVAAGVDW